MEFEKVSVIGLGYIGLPTAATFAAHGVKVLGVDVNPKVVDTINAGNIHIVEPDLDSIVRETVKKGLLKAATKPEPADAFLIAVPTPFKGDNHEPDLSYIEAAARAIAPVLKKGDLVVLESTSPVGATEQMAAWLAQARSDLTFPQTHGEKSDIRIAHCPERVLPGRVLEELIHNDRIIGGMTPLCAQKATQLYKAFVMGECIETDARTAEMCKLTENAFRDVNIAFANELSIICDKLGINVWELIKLANRHPRVNILQPGPGVGGHCIAVDPWFIVSKTPEEARLISVARQVNDSKPAWVLNKVRLAIDAFLKEHPERTPESVVVACLGLTFKPDIDDIRESPALEITRQLIKAHKGVVCVVEPNLDQECIDQLLGVDLLDIKTAFSRADISVLLVDHKEFRRVDKLEVSGKTVIDTRGVWM